MTAFRLAEHVAHTVDVNEMLDNMSPQLFTYWCAKDLIEPIGTRSTADILSKIGQLIAGLSGSKLNDKDFRPWAKTPEDRPLSVAESRAAVTAAIRAAANG